MAGRKIKRLLESNTWTPQTYGCLRAWRGPGNPFPGPTGPDPASPCPGWADPLEGGATLNVRGDDSAGTVTSGPPDSAESSAAPGSPDSREAEERLARHLRNLGRMYPVLAHDLHAFLNTMVLNLELLQRMAAREELDAEAAARIRRYASLVADEIPPLDRMLKAVVGQMRLADPPTTRFDLRTLCEELAIVFDSFARHRRVRVRTTLADVPMAFAGDRDAMAHALTSLILEAIEALPAGSLLHLTLQADRRTAILALASEPPESGEAVALLPEPPAPAREVLQRHGARLNLSNEARESARLEITLPLAPLGA